ncbi:MAG: DegV family protein [Lachnospiraceae bacterium]|nr:DegV family protein [Lachnospiraceae bacterium]
MGDYILSCCSTADLSKEDFENRDIHYISNSYEIDGIRYIDDLGESVTYPEFYQAIREGAITKTSHIDKEEYVEYFEGFLQEGKDILHITLSSGLSNTVSYANEARKELDAKYPDRTIYIVDSMAASSGYGLIMETLADKRDQGASLKELYRWIIENRMNMNHILFSTDISTYLRGGKLSKRSTILSNMMDYCQLLYMNYLGELVAKGRVRGKKNAYNAIVDKAVEVAGTDYDGKVFISNSDCLEDAKNVASMLKERLPKINGDISIKNIGNTIGSHSGPGTVAIYLWGATRVS